MLKNSLKSIIFMLIVFAIGNEIYKQIVIKPVSGKSQRLNCHTKYTTFEKIVNQKLIKNLLQTLKSDDYKIVVWADKSKHMKSVMFEDVYVEVIKNDFKQKIKEYQSTNIIAKKTNDIIIDMMVYENDKKDPNKKTEKSKLYAGYLEVTVKVDKKVVYKIQTDFMDLKGKDIPNRVSCIVNSIMSLK